MEENRRRDKLDDALLFLMGSLGILFGLIQLYVGFSTLLQFIFPVALLGWVLPFYFGFVRGAIRDSMADRYRGWIFLVFGLFLYTMVVGEEELQKFVTDPRLAWVVPASSTPLLFLVVLRMRSFRKFILGPAFPRNTVLSRSAFNALIVAGVIASAGGFLALLKFLSLWDLTILGPMTIVAAFYMWRSNYYAARIDWHYELVEKGGPLHGHRRVELACRILSDLVLVFGIAGAVSAGLVGYLGYDPPLLLPIAFDLLGLAFGLLLPAAVLWFLIRVKQYYKFDEPEPEPESEAKKDDLKPPI
jgi:hypothetical protein